MINYPNGRKYRQEAVNDEIQPVKAAKSKYNAERIEVDGIRFDSKKEANRYRQLRIMERAGIIKELQLQVPFVLIPKNANGREVKYIADFVYFQDGKKIVEDVKGFKTDVYRLKRRMMKEIHGIDINEV